MSKEIAMRSVEALENALAEFVKTKFTDEEAILRDKFENFKTKDSALQAILKDMPPEILAETKLVEKITDLEQQFKAHCKLLEKSAKAAARSAATDREAIDNPLLGSLPPTPPAAVSGFITEEDDDEVSLLLSLHEIDEAAGQFLRSGSNSLVERYKTYEESRDKLLNVLSRQPERARKLEASLEEMYKQIDQHILKVKEPVWTISEKMRVALETFDSKLDEFKRNADVRLKIDHPEAYKVATKRYQDLTAARIAFAAVPPGDVAAFKTACSTAITEVKESVWTISEEMRVALETFDSKLDEFKNKADVRLKVNHPKAYEAATKLYQDLTAARIAYTLVPPGDVAAFKTACSTAITEAEMSKLQTFRDFGRRFNLIRGAVNLVLSALGFTPMTTTSIKNVNQIKQSLNTMKDESASDEVETPRDDVVKQVHTPS